MKFELAIPHLPRMNERFRQGLKEGFGHYFPFSPGLVPWGLATGIAMLGAGFSPIEAMGMSVIVYGATAQLGTLPLIVSGAPSWLIVVTALVLNLRFLIFSATLAPAFKGVGRWQRWLSGYLLSDGVVAACASRLLTEDNPQRRLGYYLGPSLWNWGVWQVSTLIGIFAANAVPQNWPLAFMATIALLALLISMVRQKPMLLAALTGGVVAIALRGLPLRMGIFAAILAGMAAGVLAERWQTQKVDDDK
ncbi:AzlC family ABC transporter permease [Pseudogulbenkiania sp. MAI-1]|uniref:AzlC family ABC transporter permease n=1 Tax=Pseudogulbenkiania sp. MAI-1 TaxID=990370 RepID=UPI0018DDC7C2|nr:AzlC family ABC transporter permease [Pseudogulbenkiania sp. MAI-1]